LVSGRHCSTRSPERIRHGGWPNRPRHPGSRAPLCQVSSLEPRSKTRSVRRTQPDHRGNDRRRCGRRREGATDTHPAYAGHAGRAFYADRESRRVSVRRRVRQISAPSHEAVIRVVCVRGWTIYSGRLRSRSRRLVASQRCCRPDQCTFRIVGRAPTEWFRSNLRPGASMASGYRGL
jgi:hypothetical protein